jgi:signal transduction histidine kinase/CheY-like chemotaxis protein
MNWPVMTLPIEMEADVVAVRQRTRRVAELVGFDAQDQTRLATAVSEIARNAFAYAGGGRAELSIQPDAAGQFLSIRITDKGPGIADLDTIFEGRYRSSTGMGLGLIGARRLVDRFHIEAKPAKGTVVELGQRLPKRAKPITRANLTELADRLRLERGTDPLTDLRDQNRELMQSLAEIRRLQDETTKINSELNDTNRGVVALYAELDERAEQHRKASELKTRFLSNMSHEFRTPLNSILALSRLLQQKDDGPLTTEQERQVGFVRKAAEGLLDLVNDLLDLAKVEAGKVDLTPTAFMVQDLFGALRGALRPLLVSPKVELVFDVLDDMPKLVTDEGKLAQILRNLISNALKFTEAGEVRVTARYDADDGMAVFAVRDTGIGIAPRDQALIFEEFSQVDSSLQRSVKGTGLGLPLSRSLAELMRGHIELESVPGQGSVFTLSIPAVLAEAMAEAGDIAATGRKRVLVIDDDETFRYVIRQILHHDPSFEVSEAVDGEEGLRRVREERPDLVVLDLQMPNRDGFSVLEALTAENGHAPRVIVSTSLPVDQALRARLPAGTRVIPKDQVTRNNVLVSLRDAMRNAGSGAS